MARSSRRASRKPQDSGPRKKSAQSAPKRRPLPRTVERTAIADAINHLLPTGLEQSRAEGLLDKFYHLVNRTRFIAWTRKSGRNPGEAKRLLIRSVRTPLMRLAMFDFSYHINLARSATFPPREAIPTTIAPPLAELLSITDGAIELLSNDIAEAGPEGGRPPTRRLLEAEVRSALEQRAISLDDDAFSQILDEVAELIRAR